MEGDKNRQNPTQGQTSNRYQGGTSQGQKGGKSGDGEEIEDLSKEDADAVSDMKEE